MIAHADVTLADVRTNVITSGVIPDTYLIEPTGTYWESQNVTTIYNFIKTWTEAKDESVPSSLFQNKVNRALFNIATLLEGRVDNLHQVAALVTAKERALGTYSESGYLKKYHDHIINNYNIPNTASGIDTTLNQTLGDMAPLAGEITSIANRAASIAGVPDKLLESDIEYWVDVELATYCKLDNGANHPLCTPGSQNSDFIMGASTSVSATWYWRAFSCLSSYGGYSYGAVCSGTISKSKDTTFDMPPIKNQKVTGTKIYSKLTANGAPSNTEISISISVSAGDMTSGEISKTGSGNIPPLIGTWEAWDSTDVRASAGTSVHPCYLRHVPYGEWAQIPACVAETTWTFSGTSKVTIPSTGMTIKPPTCKTPVIDDISDDTGYVGHEYTYDVIGNKGGLKYTVSISKQNNPTFTIPDSDKPVITTSGKLTWDIPDNKDGDGNYIYIGTYDVTVTATDCSNPEKNDTQTFELTVRKNNPPELTATATGGVGYNVALDNLDYPDFDPDEATDAKYNRVMWRFGGTLPILGDPIRYDFRGVDNDADQTFILSVSEEPTTQLAALTDCERNVSELTVYKSGSVINSSETSPITGFACIFALDVDDGVVQLHGYGSQDAQEFTYGQASSDFIVQLSDGVADPVLLRIFYSVVDPIAEVWEAGQLLILSGLNTIDAATSTPIRNVEDLIDFITGEFKRFSVEIAFMIGDAFIDEFDDNLTMVFRCEIGVFHLRTLNCGELPEGGIEEILEYLKHIDVIGGNDVSGQQSEERKPRWTLVANVSNARNVTINDTDIKPNKVYTYVARIIVGDNATDYMPLGSITTPADRAPIIALRGPTNMTVFLDAPYVEPGYMALDDYDGNVTDSVVVTGTVDTATVGTYVLHYDVTDSAGNHAITQNRTVDVPHDASAFVTTWRTMAPNESITIPVGGALGTYTVYWGDGTVDVDVTGDRSHTYSSAGNYTVHIYGDFDRIRLFAHYHAAKLQSIDQWGDAQWTSMLAAFEGAANMGYTATDVPDLSLVTNTNGMFGYAYSFDGDISEWDVSSVTDMGYMFYRAYSFDSDISEWDVSSVTDMKYMFYDASSFNADISGWNVSSATDMNFMFYGATAFDQNLGDWYIIPDDTAIDHNDAARTVGNITAQNAFLDGQGPVYGIGTGGDSGSFEMDGAALKLRAVPDYSNKSSYTVNVTATGDGIFGTGNSRILDITVVERNNPPVVDAGADQTVREGETVRLDGSASDTDGDSLTYAWSHDSPLDIMLADAGSLSTTFLAPQVTANTTITVSLTVHDGTDAAADSANITVMDVPDPPAAPANLRASSAMFSVALAWDDPDDDTITGYKILSRPAAESEFVVSVNDTGSAATTHTIPGLEPGTNYAFRIIAINEHGESEPSQTVSISTQPNNPPVADAGPPQTVRPGHVAYLNGTGSVDPDGGTLSYSWSQISGPNVSLSDATAAAPTFTAPSEPASLEFRLVVTDGHLSANDTTTVTIPDTVPPAITLSGSANMTVSAGSPYAEPGYMATDNVDGDLAGYVVVTGTVDTGTPGTYTLHYDVSDSSGNAAITQNRTVHVVDTTPPAITLKGKAAITMPMGPVFTDPGYAATDNVDGNLTGRVAATGTVDPLIPGTYTISYQVTDSSGNVGNQTRIITVSPPADTTSYCNDMTLAQLMASDKYNIINKMFSSESTVTGTDAADLIIAGEDGPTIKGGAGDDCIIGGTGADTLWGQGGDDTIFGRGGDDTMYGGDDDDQMWGQGGDDAMYGGMGADTMRGGTGADEMRGEDGSDIMRGGMGADTMYGGDDGDQMWGLDGADTMYGEGGDDTMYGGRNNDTMYGGPGADAMRGGPGADTIHWEDDDTRIGDDDSGDD